MRERSKDRRDYKKNEEDLLLRRKGVCPLAPFQIACCTAYLQIASILLK
jgi:hypothetical protein